MSQSVVTVGIGKEEEIASACLVVVAFLARTCPSHHCVHQGHVLEPFCSSDPFPAQYTDIPFLPVLVSTPQKGDFRHRHLIWCTGLIC